MRTYVLAFVLALTGCTTNNTGSAKNPNNVIYDMSPQEDLSQHPNKDLSGFSVQTGDMAGVCPTPTGGSCTANTQFCGGNDVRFCADDGAHSGKVMTCSGGSATNPVICGANCPAGQTACCQTTQPLMMWTVYSDPQMTVLQDKQAVYGLDWPTHITQPRVCDSRFTVGYSTWNDKADCTTAGMDMQFSVPRPASLGSASYALPDTSNAGLQFTLQYADPARACSTWTGDIRIWQMEPAWEVTINVVCSDVGKSNLTYYGTVKGFE